MYSKIAITSGLNRYHVNMLTKKMSKGKKVFFS